MRLLALAALLLFPLLAVSCDDRAEQAASLREMRPSDMWSEEDEARMKADREERRKQEAAGKKALLDSAVAATDLSAAFRSNPIRMVHQYEGKGLVVTGKVIRISRGMSGKGMVFLAGATAYFDVMTSFDDARGIVDISVDQTVFVQCAAVTALLNTPSLEDCALLDAG